MDICAHSVEIKINERRMINSLTFICLTLIGLNAFSKVDFVDLASVNPDIKIEMRYFSNWNFIGRKVVGYNTNKCFLTKQAANALSEVQRDLEKQRLSLLVFDCYRPQRAVTSFVEWTKDAKDNQMQNIFYPDEPKSTLIERGYIASRSGHSRGSTVDLTIVQIATNGNYHEETSDCRYPKTNLKQLDMGTYFDCFSSLSNTNDTRISKEAISNRKLLKTTMEKHGFKNYSKEWWHYTLKNEPFKDQYFDFVIE
jgi:D-alanyl-D-alanine dipeptidase